MQKESVGLRNREGMRDEVVTDFKAPARIRDNDDDDDVDNDNDKCQAPGRCDWQQPSSKLIAHNLEKWVKYGSCGSTAHSTVHTPLGILPSSSIELKSVLFLLQVLLLSNSCSCFCPNCHPLRQLNLGHLWRY